MEEELEAKDNELEKMRTDMEILGQKLIDEIEKRADLAAAQESVQGELEELTQTLFVSFAFTYSSNTSLHCISPSL